MNEFDKQIPNINVPTLTPTKYAPPAVPANIMKNSKETGEWLDWLVNHVPKPIKSKVNAMKKSVLKTVKDQERQHKKIMKEYNQRQERETKRWTREIEKEETRQHNIIKKQREQLEKARLKAERQQRDIEEAAGWRGSKKFAQIRRRLRNKLENRKQRARVHRRAHNGHARDYVIDNNVVIGPREFLKQSKPEVFRVIGHHIPSKVILRLECVFVHTDMKTGTKKEEEAFLSTQPVAIIEGTDLEEQWVYFRERMEEMIVNFLKEKSGWRIKRVISLHISVSDYQPLQGGTWVELPEFFRNKKAIINIKNTDNQCFQWAITRALNPVKRDAERVTSKEFKRQSEDLNWDKIEFPATRVHFGIFERKNPDVALTVYTSEGEKIFPLWISPKKDAPKKAINTLSLWRSLHGCEESEQLVVIKTSWC